MEKNRVILIIDDDQDITNPLISLFEKKGHTVYCAKNGQEGHKLLLENYVDVAIVDLSLSRGSGFEFLKDMKILQEEDRPITYIITANHEIDEETLRKDGVSKIIYKPFKFPSLANDVDTLLKKKN